MILPHSPPVVLCFLRHFPSCSCSWKAFVNFSGRSRSSLMAYFNLVPVSAGIGLWYFLAALYHNFIVLLCDVGSVWRFHDSRCWSVLFAPYFCDWRGSLCSQSVFLCFHPGWYRFWCIFLGVLFSSFPLFPLLASASICPPLLFLVLSMLPWVSSVVFCIFCAVVLHFPSLFFLLLCRVLLFSDRHAPLWHIAPFLVSVA